MSRIVIPSLAALIAVIAATSYQQDSEARASMNAAVGASPAPVRAGIAIIGTGGAAALDRVTALDSATGHFIVVTRPACPASCAPLDSASGTIAPAEVERLFALIESEHVFSLRDDYGTCEQCGDAASYATTVQANGRRKVITSDGAVTPMVLGRVHVALAETIRLARGHD